MVFAVERREDGAFLGCCGVAVEAGGAAEVGYWIGRPFWGRGYATEALGAVVDLAFDRLGVDRVRASAMPANRASIRVQEKLGFSFVGEAEEPAPARGGPVKVEVRALTREAYERRRESRLPDSRSVPIVLVSAVALIDADGRVLLAQRPEGKPMAGLWEFPGGKVQDGETPEAALIRELQEELGIDVSESCLAPFTFASHRYETFHLLMPLYVCRKWQGQVRAREGQALAWVRPSRLGDYPMPPADKPLVPMLRDFL
jgi:8-oxo-dGTP diphosphatase